MLRDQSSDADRREHGRRLGNETNLAYSIARRRSWHRTLYRFAQRTDGSRCVYLHLSPLCSIVCSGWCTYFTCLKRLSTFYTIVALGTEYHLWFTGSNPGHFRFHLLNTIGGTSDHPGEGIKLSIWYKNPQRKDVYKVLAAELFT